MPLINLCMLLDMQGFGRASRKPSVLFFVFSLQELSSPSCPPSTKQRKEREKQLNGNQIVMKRGSIPERRGGEKYLMHVIWFRVLVSWRIHWRPHQHWSEKHRRWRMEELQISPYDPAYPPYRTKSNTKSKREYCRHSGLVPGSNKNTEIRAWKESTPEYIDLAVILGCCRLSFSTS